MVKNLWLELCRITAPSVSVPSERCCVVHSAFWVFQEYIHVGACSTHDSMVCSDEFLAGLDVETILWRLLQSDHVDTGCLLLDGDVLECHLEVMTCQLYTVDTISTIPHELVWSCCGCMLACRLEKLIISAFANHRP